MAGAVLNKLCLRPTYSLRRQLIVSYGCTAMITIMLVVIVGTIAAIHAGNVVKDQTSDLLNDQLSMSLTNSSQQTSDLFTKKFDYIRGNAALLTEIIRDRIVGYPDEFEDDAFIPFVDMDTGLRKYPILGQKLPRDFEVIPNWNDENMAEHLQERADALGRFKSFMSSRSAFFSFQGNCDPQHISPSAPGYFPNCTEANNDASLGGTVHRSRTLAGLEQKAADIGIFLKPLWESVPNAQMISVFYHNSGTGAISSFPSFSVVSSRTYESSGCDWMKEINPYTKTPYGNETDMQRCSPAGTQVPIRKYNPMERKFCHDQIRNPGETRIYGPYLDSVWGQWRLTVGQAVYDRRTGNFIACTGIDLNLELASDLLDSVVTNNRTKVAIVRPDGTVVAGAGFAPSQVTETVNIADTGFADKNTFQEMESRFDWGRAWDPAVVQGQLLQKYVQSNGEVVTALPSPRPPDKYDPKYEPEFWILLSLRVQDVFGVTKQIDEKVQHEVSELILHSVLIGVGGLVLFLVIVFLISQILTRPLKWMETTAWKIVNHADKRVSNDVVVVEQETEDPLFKCTPKTEVLELVSEFETMIQGFSGSEASRVAVAKVEEVKNLVTWKEDYRQIYDISENMETKIKEINHLQSFSKRLSFHRGSLATATSLPYNSADIGVSEATVSEFEESAAFRSAELKPGGAFAHLKRSGSGHKLKKPTTRTNMGSNKPVGTGSSPIDDIQESLRISRSSLFRWILISIVVPLLLTIIIICALVALDLLNSFPESVEKGNNISIRLEQEYLQDTATLGALAAEHVLPNSLRDLYVVTRVAGWLLFNGLERSDSFTETEFKFVEECKRYEEPGSCPFEMDKSRAPCDCQWEDPWVSTCQNYEEDSRQLQKAWFMSQAIDFDPQTGNRNSTPSFPSQSAGAATTAWWDNMTEIPGFEKGSNASGYGTAYDRFRVVSAVAAASLPIYNYIGNDRSQRLRSSLSSYVAFEADGSFWGYAGCNYDFARYAQFKSTGANRAYLIRPDVCPLGKFGYDPRCRPWYADVKRKAVESNAAVHLTAPYTFATVTDVGTSAGSPLIDPKTGEYVGSTLIDLPLNEIFEILENADSDFYFVLSLDNDAEESEIVVGPGHPMGSAPAMAADVVLPDDPEESSNRSSFDDITKQMSTGASGKASFSRTSEKGVEELITLYYAPVYARVLKPVRPDDFSRGAQVSRVLLYSIAVAQSQTSAELPFKETEQEMNERLQWTTAVYVISVAMVTVLCVVVTARISIAISEPMLILLRVVQRVNVGRIEDDMPPLMGGSREVNQVYTSFAKLYKVVRMSNSSFFSGDFKWAHHIASDGLKLFRKIGDEKAIAIACNNIGNTLLALSVQSREKGSCLKVDCECCVKAALEHFNEAIKIGTREFEEADSDALKASFAQQIADRHFNRAMCLLHSLDDPCCPENGRESALNDLFRCREYDRGVEGFFLHEKLMFRYSDICFERLVRRLHGLTLLFELDNSSWQIWNVNDLVDQADLMLQAAWEQNSAPVFRDLNKVGRLQQLEGAVMGLELVSGKPEEAARLAMRMFIEDDYIVDSSFVVAADSVLRYMREPTLKPWTPETTIRTSLEFRKMRKSGKRTALDMERCFIFCLELGRRMVGGDLLVKLNEEITSFYDENCHGRDRMGLVALSNSVDSNLIVKLAPKDEDTENQKAGLDTATREVGGSTSYPALPTAINMVAKSAASSTCDVFLVYISDGSLWDARSFATMQKRIKQANSRRSASIDILAIGLEVEDEPFSEFCRNLCMTTRSRHSKYFSATLDSIGDVFESVSNLISSSSSAETKRLQLGMTMERF